MRNLLAYSLVESRQNVESYSIHSVVHDWCTETISYGKVDLIMLATIIVGFAVPGYSEPEYWLSQQRLIPHADRCTQQLHNYNPSNTIEYSKSSNPFNNLGLLYADQGRLAAWVGLNPVGCGWGRVMGRVGS